MPIQFIMKIGYLPFLLLFCSSCSNSENKDMDKTDIQKAGIEFHEINYGIGTADKVRIMTDSLDPTGKSSYGKFFNVTHKTDTIPAHIGSEFGIVYSVNATSVDDVELTKVWIFPSVMHNPITHKSYDRLVRTVYVNQASNSYSAYKLEDSFEVIKGEWKFRIYYKQHLLYAHHFYVQ